MLLIFGFMYFISNQKIEHNLLIVNKKRVYVKISLIILYTIGVLISSLYFSQL